MSDIVVRNEKCQLGPGAAPGATNPNLINQYAPPDTFWIWKRAGGGRPKCGTRYHRETTFVPSVMVERVTSRHVAVSNSAHSLSCPSPLACKYRQDSGLRDCVIDQVTDRRPRIIHRAVARSAPMATTGDALQILASTVVSPRVLQHILGVGSSFIALSFPSADESVWETATIRGLGYEGYVQGGSWARWASRGYKVRPRVAVS